jgi:hypothetical protein
MSSLFVRLSQNDAIETGWGALHPVTDPGYEKERVTTHSIIEVRYFG